MKGGGGYHGRRGRGRREGREEKCEGWGGEDWEKEDRRSRELW